MNQLELEALTSRRNARTILQRTISEELDGVLLDWALQAFIIIPTWLDNPWLEDQKPYQSKQDKINVLKDWLKGYGLENLILDIAYSVLHEFKDPTLQSAIGTLASTLPYDDPFDAASMAGSLIAILGSKDDKGFYTLINNARKRKMHEVRINHWPDLVPAFAGAHQWINDTLFNLPLVEPPKIVKDNNSAGYHSIREPLILGKFTQHNKHTNKLCINILNQMQWQFDPLVLAIPPTFPDKLTDESVTALEKGMEIAQRYLKDKPFHLIWQYCSRGRLYSHGYHVNFQSFEWMKASINLVKQHRLTL